MGVTEQGVAMLSSILNSERAIKVNCAIMRTFVKMTTLRGPLTVSDVSVILDNIAFR